MNRLSGSAAVLSLALASVVCCQSVAAQTPPSTNSAVADTSKIKDPLDRESPQSCVIAFQQACHSQNFARAVKYLDLRKLPQSDRLKDGSALAKQLCEILDRDTQFEVADLSRNPEGDRASSTPDRVRIDSFSVNGKTQELDLERVTLRSHMSIWLFSTETVARIPLLARMVTSS